MITREEIFRLRQECAVTICDTLRYAKGYERFVAELDAKKAWLAGLDSCGLCHGTGNRLEPVLRDPLMITDDGMVKVRRFFGGENYGTIYEGWEPYDPVKDGPQTREVFCTHS